MTISFEHEALPGRVSFGAGRFAAVPAEVDRLERGRAVVVAGSAASPVVEQLRDALGRRCVGVVDGARQHVPEADARAARVQVTAFEADVLVAVGGGSAIGLAKAVALTTRLPIIAVPTTYSGSEMTPVWGITSHGRKSTGRDPAVLPTTVVYDPELTLSLPRELSVASGMNSLAHCVEALWADPANPFTAGLASEGIRLLTTGLVRLVDAPRDVVVRSDVLAGACLGGAVLATVGTGIHHRLAHVLGGSFGLPHADVHTVLLPYTAARELGREPVVAARAARAFGIDDVPGALWDLGRRLGARRDLAGLHLPEASLAEAADIAASTGLLPAPEALELLRRAHHGRRPTA